MLGDLVERTKRKEPGLRECHTNFSLCICAPWCMAFIMKFKIGVKGKVAFIFIVMGILLVCGVGFAAYSLSYEQVAEQYTSIALKSAKMAATLVDGDEIESYLNNCNSEGYHETYESLHELKSVCDLKYLYIIRPDIQRNDGIYIFDIYSDGNDLSLIADEGTHTGEMDVYDVVLETYLTGFTDTEPIITDTVFGFLASAFAPVYKSDGSIVAVVRADISMDIIVEQVRSQTIQLLITTLFIITLILIILLIIIHRLVLVPVTQLSQHMENFTTNESELQEFEVLKSNDELQTMSESFNRMVDDLRKYIKNLTDVTVDRERIAAELNVATRIQAGMLPCIFPPFPDRKEFDIFASMVPAKEVGGDYYDFFLIDEHNLAVIIADVSDKGVPAALFMVITKTLLKNTACSGKSPKEVFEIVNNLLCENNETCMFVTAFMGNLDLRNGRFTYVNAGHNYPLIKKADADYAYLKTKPSFVLAGSEDMTFVEEELYLRPDDILYLYTDGVTEALNERHEFFSESRLLAVINKYKDCAPYELLSKIKIELDNFAGKAQQADDMTMLALRMNPATT